MPRLSVSIFVLWMTTCALLLAHSISAFGGKPPGVVVVSCVFAGASVTATLVTIYACLREAGWKTTEPGHWFNFVATWEWLEQHSNRLGTPDWFAFVGITGLLLLGLRTTNWPRFWKGTFAMYAVAASVSLSWRVTNQAGWNDLTNSLRSQLSPLLYGATLLALIAAIAVDFRKAVFRDWIHWVGIGYVLFKWDGLIRAYVIPYLFPS